MANQQYATRWQDAAIQFQGTSKRLRKKLRDLTLSGLQAFDMHRQPKFLRCLACHYVFDDQLDQFRKIIGMLKDRGAFVTTDTCLSMLHGEQEIDDRYFHLSFDDGFLNVVNNALPILKEFEVPAIIFVPSSLVGADFAQAHEYSVDVAKYQMAIEMATWDDLKKAIDEGFEVGSHTRTHARLSSLSNEEEALNDELGGSKHQIESQLGIRCRYIAYPFGKPGDYDQTTLNVTRKAGYDAGFGIHRGTVKAGETDPMLVPRHHFEPEWPLSHIRYFANGNMEKYWEKKLDAAKNDHERNA